MSSSHGVKPFENNWAYLKTELRWLDRVLMLAVSRKRQDDKTLHRVANTPADKVTSHWWKGIITVNKGIDDREGPPPKMPNRTVQTVSYSQQLEARIQASYQGGITLAIPLLRDRLKLSEVEKNIVLMAIAPEINRRYGRLYDFLQEEEGALADLPTVDLCLRLLCRNDNDWQQARSRLTASYSLVNLGLLEWIGDEDGTLLSQQVRVSDDLANFLLADYPKAATLEAILADSGVDDAAFLAPVETSAAATSNTNTHSTPQADQNAPDQSPGDSSTQQIAIGWDNLVLTKKLIHQLQYLGRQAEQRQNHADLNGLIILFAGDAGTGKTIAAAAIASQINLPLSCVELEALTPDRYPNVLTDSPKENSSLLVVKQGEQWFGRKSQVEQDWLHQWWQWRKQFGLTLITVSNLEAVRPHWRQKFDGVLTFPRPDAKARQRLWQQAFAPELKTQNLDWSAIAKQLPLTGGEIWAIAQTIQLDLKARRRTTVTLQALRDALQLHHPQLELKLPTQRKN